MLAPGNAPAARRADTSRRSTETPTTTRPRRALRPADDTGPRRVVRTAVGAVATAAMVGGMSWVAADPAAARPVGYDMPRLAPGQSGKTVVRLQRELTAMGHQVPDTGYYGTITTSKVKRVQANNGWKQTGVAGYRVWHRLFTDGNKVKPVKKMPKQDKKPQHSTPVGSDFGNPQLRYGAENADVVQLQRELTAHGLSVPDTGWFGPMTRDRVKTMQKRHGWKQTGVAGYRVWGALLHDGKRPPKNPYNLDSRCLTGGRVICIDKTKQKLYYLENNKVVRKMDARFGCSDTATRNGVFTVFRKERHWTSTLYWTKMPYSMFFSGGQAVHYSSDFKARGYAGCSHGCVNIREKKKLAYVFKRVKIDDRLVVYYS